MEIKNSPPAALSACDSAVYSHMIVLPGVVSSVCARLPFHFSPSSPRSLSGVPFTLNMRGSV